MSKLTINPKLEKIQLWQDANKIAKAMYKVCTELPEEEKWVMQNRLRSRAFDLTNEIAEAFGSIDPREKTYNLGLARRAVYGVKNTYKQASVAGHIELNPDIMVQIDAITNGIDEELKATAENIQGWYELFRDQNTTPARQTK